MASKLGKFGSSRREGYGSEGSLKRMYLRGNIEVDGGEGAREGGIL